VYQLPLPQGRPAVSRHPAARREKSLPEAMLFENVQWFCSVRWIVIGILGAFGILGQFPGLMAALALLPPGPWPLAAAGVLTAANIAYLAHARAARRSAPAPRRVAANLWSQILIDLLVLTAVMHFVGGVHTYIPFMYVFHIVLACVFFPRRASLLVTGIAIAMFLGAFALERLGIIPPATIFAHDQPVAPSVAKYDLLFAVGIWQAVWYLASHLSALVRQRDEELDQANILLLKAQEERAEHMLRTTHQLKAPFSAIHANAQLLVKGYCGDLPAEALKVAQGILARCTRLTSEIQCMLQLANLSSQSSLALPRARLDVAEVLAGCVGQVRPTATARGNVLEEDIRPAFTVGVEDHLKMLFENLLSNAVAYSHPGGHICVRCGPGPRGEPVVTIADDGIGIEPEKLPRIFEEYYRTQEAVRHNKESSGLGLAIVRAVAQRHRIGIRVESVPGRGTTFVLRLPPADGRPGDAEGVEDDPPADRG
jgi:signal transduction histidine kinase